MDIKYLWAFFSHLSINLTFPVILKLDLVNRNIQTDVTKNLYFMINCTHIQYIDRL